MKKRTLAQACADVDTIKNAARRLQEHLTTPGVTITHADALNALTASLGAANWRTLRDKLNQPKRTAVAEAVKVWDASKPRWTVHAVYTDNDQRYGDDFFGATALEAQINAQMDRLADDGWMTRIDVSCVIDQLTGQSADQETLVSDAELIQESESIMRVCLLAQAKLGLPPVSGIEASDEYDCNMRAVEFWSELCAGWNSPKEKEDSVLRELRSTLDGMAEEYKPDLSEFGEEPTLFTDSRGVQDTLDVVDALRRVADLASKGMDLTQTYDAKETGVFQVLQTYALLLYFGHRLAVILNGAEI